jgi:hypothetical protein
VKRTLVLLVLWVLLFLNHNFIFAEQDTSSYNKDEAIFSAFKEEAMQEAFQEIEMSALLDGIERDGGTSASNLFFETHSYLKTDIVYNDNIWHVADNVKDDVYLYLNPGIKIALSNLLELYANKLRQKLELDLGAEVTNSFFRAVALNRESPYAKLTYNLDGGKNKLNFSGGFLKGYDLSSDLVSDTEGLIGFLGNAVDISWEHSFNRLGFGLSYERAYREYAKEFKRSNTYENNVGIVTGFLNLTPKTRVFLEFDLGRYEYTEALTNVNDYDYNMLWVGARGRLSKKLFGLAKIGIQNYKYAGGSSNNGLLTVKTDLEYRQSPRSTFLLNLAVGDTSTGYVDLGMDRQYAAKLSFLRELNRKLDFKGDISYVKDDYNSGQIDNTFGYSLGLSYLFREWMKMNLSYEYLDKSSTARIAEYKYNRYLFGAEITF